VVHKEISSTKYRSMENSTLVKILLLFVSFGIFLFDATYGFISLIVMQGTVFLLEYRRKKMEK
jgi:hypothetical protein